jgi:hypothetical protein
MLRLNAAIKAVVNSNIVISTVPVALSDPNKIRSFRSDFFFSE